MRPIASVCIIAAALASASPARAQTPAEFYRGKTINLDIGSSVGGGYDIHGRLLARHIGKHIPGNPTVVPRNVEGAGGLRLANVLYNSAPRDGTAFRHRVSQRPVRSTARQQGRPIRRHQIYLDRQHQQ